MDVPDDVATVGGRIATYHRPHHFTKRRASASSKKKALSTITWPHEQPTPEDLARAGFYFKPSAASQDSVTCFLCGKALDGWDPEDDPVAEHLSHVPDCGWAINVAVESRSQDMDRAEEDPLNERMMESRRSTFMDAWPHEGKKGWKCKMQKMVEAGWCYSPLPDADDCVHCFYCGVSLDGWERKDDPWEEHRRRAPECHFFTLVDESAKVGNQKPKAARGQQSRVSKAARVSTQSIQPGADDLPPLDFDDSLAEDDDTVLTTASTVSKTGKSKKKGVKSKAAPKKTRTAKAKQASTLDDSKLSDADVSDAGLSKTQSLQKRQDSVAGDALSRDVDSSELAPRKTRATRTKKASVMDDATVTAAEASMHIDSTVMSSPHLAKFPKIRAHRQLQAEAATEQISELRPLESETVVPAKPARPTRKVSQAKGPKVKRKLVQESVELRGEDETSTPEETRKATRGKKRTSDGFEKIESSVVSVNTTPVKVPKAKAVDLKKSQAASRAIEQLTEQEPAASAGLNLDAKSIVDTAVSKDPGLDVTEGNCRRSASNKASQDKPGQLLEDCGSVQSPATPPLVPSNLSPTASPQSSDVENHPPSSHPSFKIPIPSDAPRSSVHQPLENITPVPSPSKRIIASGLTSTAPWTPVDLEHIFLPSPSSRRIQGIEDEECMTVEGIMECLTSPEKRMSVEEWILLNAEKAEERLKGECERLIGAFEGEGIRALRALEGVSCV